jgi:hypothetical protein
MATRVSTKSMSCGRRRWICMWIILPSWADLNWIGNPWWGFTARPGSWGGPENAHDAKGQLMTSSQCRRLTDEYVVVNPGVKGVAGVFKELANLAYHRGPERTVGGLRLAEHPDFLAVEANAEEGDMGMGPSPLISHGPTIADNQRIRCHRLPLRLADWAARSHSAKSCPRGQIWRLSTSLSLTLSPTRCNAMQLAAVLCNVTPREDREQVLVTTGDSRRVERGLKILVSAVQSRPCPPGFSARSHHPPLRAGGDACCSDRHFSTSAVDARQTEDAALDTLRGRA